MARKKTRQPRSRGSVTERSPGTFLVRVFVGVDEGTGKRKYHNETVKGTRKDADKALTRILREMDTGTLVKRSSDTLEGYYEGWLAGKRGLAPKARDGYRTRIKKDILPVIGKKKITELRKADVERVISGMEKRGLSTRTIHMTYVALNMMLDAAMLEGLLLSNPCRLVELPTLEKKVEPKVLTPEQVKQIIEETRGDRFHALWTLLLTTGLRPSEALALTWDDFNGESVKITKSLSVDPEDHHRVKVTAVKTRKAVRVVPLFKVAVEALADLRLQQKKDLLQRKLKGNPENLVFCTWGGAHLGNTFVRKHWNQTLDRLKIERVRLYDQRHTHATHMLVAGIHPKVVSERMGHARTAFTMDTYTTLLKGMQEEAVSEAEKKLGYGT